MLYLLQFKNSPNDKWRVAKFSRPMPKEQAEKEMQEFDEMGSAYRVRIVPVSQD